MPERNGPLQLVPPGFLHLLGLKNQGHLPADLGEVVAPVLEMAGWYLRTNAQVDALVSGISLSSASNQEGVFSPNSIDCPAGETWFIHEYSIRAGVPAGATNQIVNLAPLIRYNNAGTIRWGLLGPSGSAAAAAGNGAGVTVGAQGFWMPPGSSLGFYYGLALVAAGTIDLLGTIRATKLKL